MNEETNEFLKANLEEAHYTFKNILGEMKDNNISIDYDELETKELDYYRDILNIIDKMHYNVSLANDLKEGQIKIMNNEYKLYLKYFSLYIVSFVYIGVFHEIYDISKLNDIVKYLVGMFLGSTYMFLLNKDIKDNRTDTKEKRELINRLKTIKEEYKSNHDHVVFAIDEIFSVNDTLWDFLDREKIKSKSI